MRRYFPFVLGFGLTVGISAVAAAATGCGPDQPYTETNPTSIQNYCGACGFAGGVEPTSLTCHGNDGFHPYGPLCVNPSCTGCGCTLGCTGDSQCATNQYCATSGPSAGSCQWRTCGSCETAVNHACASCSAQGQVCQTGSCVASCSSCNKADSSNTCQACSTFGDKCLGGNCVPPGTCASDNDCSGSQYCGSGETCLAKPTSVTFDSGAPPAEATVNVAFRVTARANGGGGAIGTVISAPGNSNFCSGNGAGCSANYTATSTGTVGFTAAAYVNDISGLKAVTSASVNVTILPAPCQHDSECGANNFCSPGSPNQCLPYPTNVSVGQPTSGGPYTIGQTVIFAAQATSSNNAALNSYGTVVWIGPENGKIGCSGQGADCTSPTPGVTLAASDNGSQVQAMVYVKSVDNALLKVGTAAGPTLQVNPVGFCSHTSDCLVGHYCGLDQQCHLWPTVTSVGASGTNFTVDQMVNFSGSSTGAEPARIGMVIQMGGTTVCTGQGNTCDTTRAGASPGPHKLTNADAAMPQPISISGVAFVLDIDNVSIGPGAVKSGGTITVGPAACQHDIECGANNFCSPGSPNQCLPYPTNVSVVQPTSGAPYTVGQTVIFAAQATSPNNAALNSYGTVVWIGPENGKIGCSGQGADCTSPTPGVTLAASDNGAQVQAIVYVKSVDNALLKVGTAKGPTLQVTSLNTTAPVFTKGPTVGAYQPDQGHAGQEQVNITLMTDIPSTCTINGATFNSDLNPPPTSNHWVTLTNLTPGSSPSYTIQCTNSNPGGLSGPNLQFNLNVPFGATNKAPNITGTSVTPPSPEVSTQTVVQISATTDINSNCTIDGTAFQAGQGTTSHLVNISNLTSGFNQDYSVLCSTAPGGTNSAPAKVTVMVCPTGQAPNGSGQCVVTVNPISISITPTGASLIPGQSRLFTATTADGSPLPSDFSWNISGPGGSGDQCTLSNTNGSNTTVKTTTATKLGTCILLSSSTITGFRQATSIVITNTPVASITFDNAPPGMAPNSTQVLIVTAHDGSGNPIVASDMNVTASSECTVVSQGYPEVTTSYDVTVKAGAGIGTCTLTATAVAEGATAALPISILNTLLQITSPVNGTGFLLRSTSDMIVISGVVAGNTPVTCGGGPGTFKQVSPLDPVTGLSGWECDWNDLCSSQASCEAESGQVPNGTLMAGAHTVTASAQGLTQQSVTFKIFDWPPAPTLAISTDKVFAGTPVTLTGAGCDDPNNPNPPDTNITKCGLTAMNLYEDSNAATPVGGLGIVNGQWTTNISTGPGQYSYVTKSTNMQGDSSVASNPVNLTVLQKPTIVITSPANNAMFTSGTKVTVSATLTDPSQIATSVAFNIWGTSTTWILPHPGNNVYSFQWQADMSSGPYVSMTATVYFQNIPVGALSADSPPVNIIVADSPTIVSPAQATLMNGGLQATLSAQAASSYFGNSGLSYQWTLSAGAPAPVAFDFNGANPTTRATFTKAGSYTFTATATDPLGASVKTSTTVVVAAALQVSPSPAFALAGSKLQMNTPEKDQFGNAITGNCVWSTTCPASVGSIDPQSGLFTAAATGAPCTVSVSEGSQTGSATITVTDDIPPTVQITAVTPSNANYVAPITLTLTASASDPGSAIQKVQFYENGLPVGSALTQSPYTYVWKNMEPGNYYIAAVATDANGTPTTSSYTPVTVYKPAVAISTITPASATTQDNSAGNPPFVFTVEGSGFVAPGTFTGSQVYWNGQPAALTIFKSGDILDAVLEVHLNNGELLNPQTAIVQVVSPKDPANPVPNANISLPVNFIVEGPPIVKCIDPTNRGICSNASGALAVGAAAAAPQLGLPPTVTRNTIMGAVTQYADFIQWSVYGEGTQLTASTAGNGSYSFRSTSPALFQSAFVRGATFSLSNLPGSLGSGNYVIVAQGMNLAGAVSAPAQATFFLTATDLSSVRVYPNPWRSDKDAGYLIVFDQMTPGSTLKIFTVSGHWVQTLTADANGVIKWDRKNSAGELVQSGLYFYLVNDGQGDKVHGKFAIIR